MILNKISKMDKRKYLIGDKPLKGIKTNIGNKYMQKMLFFEKLDVLILY